MADMLPPEAKDDPAFIDGHGSMLAVNQPQLAAKYGVIRGGQRVPPQQMHADPNAARRPVTETVKDLETLHRAYNKAAPANPAVKESSPSVAVSAPPAADAEPKKSGTVKDVKKALSEMDDFDFSQIRRQMSKDIINNPDQQAAIEARLAPLSIDDLIIRDFVEQRVPIIPGRFEVTYRSMSGEVDLALKQLLMEESGKTNVSDQYVLDKFAFMTLTAGTAAINGNPTPRHTDADGNFSPEAFWVKFNWMVRRPLHMLASISTNHIWFEMRVRKLFVAETVKNG
jgi:hypothetical protein